MNKQLLLIALISFAVSSFAIDLGDESMADKADRFDFEDFHKEKGVTIWEETKEKNTTTYEEDSKSTTAITAAPVASKNPAVIKKQFEKGDELKVREAYKLGNDPALRNLQSLYDATEALHKQLNGFCPNGWAKDSEWHKPEQGYFYIHYSAICL